MTDLFNMESSSFILDHYKGHWVYAWKDAMLFMLNKSELT